MQIGYKVDMHPNFFTIFTSLVSWLPNIST